jgi:ubiquitin-conjugating enzyme E2 Z
MISKRLQKEIVHLKDNSLKETGIFYFIVDESITKGTSIMFGPKNTPYEYCPMEYSFELLNEYPFSPPKVLYKTNDGRTRFHPNFYVDGKVCLSILGTYSGPKWASSMNLTTVLLSIYSLITDNPLVHEPCFENTSLTNPRNANYALWVEHQIIKLFLDNYNYNYYKKFCDIDEDFKKCLDEKYELIKEKIKLKAKDEEKEFIGLTYSMNGTTIYKKLVEKI